MHLLLCDKCDLILALWIRKAFLPSMLSILSYSPALQIPECRQSTRLPLWCVRCPQAFPRGRRAGCYTAHTQLTGASGWFPDTSQSHLNTFWHRRFCPLYLKQFADFLEGYKTWTKLNLVQFLSNPSWWGIKLWGARVKLHSTCCLYLEPQLINTPQQFPPYTS